MSDTVTDILETFRVIYPNNLFYVCKCTAPGGGSWYSGQKILLVQLKDGDWLAVHRLTKSWGLPMSNKDVEQKVLPFIADTKDITDSETRCNQLHDDLTSVFPDHHVNIFIYEDSWQNAYYSKGSATFTNEYGSDVCIVLS